MSGRHGLRLLALPLATLAAAFFASTASAHAVLERTSPADGTNLSYAPAQLRLWFSEDISSRFRDIRVVDARGRRVRASSIASPAGDSSLVVVRLPKLKRGTYGVLWRVLSADDGHVTGGNLAFGVRAASVATGSDRSSGFSRLEALLRWLDFSLLAGVAGCVAVVALVLARIRPSPVLTVGTLAVARARLLRAGIWFALLAGVAGIARLVWQSHELSSVGGSLTDLAVQDRWGLLWLVRELALLALVGVLALPTNNRVSPPAIVCRMSVAGVLLVVVGAAHAATSHAAALDPKSPGAVVADAVHVLAAATWLGGVAALAIALWPAGAIGRTEASALARGCSRPFAELAAVGVGLVVATGLYSAGRQVASVDALLTTDYGHMLLLKTGVVVLVLGFGAANFALLRSPARSRLGRLATGDPSRGALGRSGVPRRSRARLFGSRPWTRVRAARRPHRDRAKQLRGGPPRDALGDADAGRDEHVHGARGELAETRAGACLRSHPRGEKRWGCTRDRRSRQSPV